MSHKKGKSQNRKHTPAPVVLMIHPKTAFPSDGVAIEKLKDEFAAAGYKLINVEFSNTSPMPPRFDRL